MNLFRRNCRYAERLPDYLEGELSSEWALRVEEHVQACAVCGGELRELRAVMQLTRSLPTHPVPRSFRLDPAMVRPAREIPVEKAPAGSGGFGLFRRPELAMRYGAAVASVALLAVLVTDISSSDPSPQTAADGAVLELSSVEKAAGSSGAEESASTLAQDALPAEGEAGASDGDDAALVPPDAERAAGEPQPVALVVEEGGRDEALLAAEIGLAAVAAAAVGGSIYWARRRG